MGKSEKMVQLAIEVADDDSHGYSQNRRWPSQGTDFDCSSLVYWSAHEAGYDVPLSGYTGTMYDDFTAAGFKAKRYGSVTLERGYVLLAHNSKRQHTEIYIGDGMTAGAHIASNGDIEDWNPGDQTGNEISVAPIYGDWDWVLIPPDGASPASASAKPASAKPAGKPPTSPEYRVFRDGKWHSWKSDGATAGTSASDVYDMDFRYLGPGGWFQLTLEGGEALPRNRHNDGHAKKVIGVTVYYDTDTSKTGGAYYEAVYRVYSGGRWLKWEHDDEDGGAGDDKNAVRRFQLKLAMA